MKCLAISLSTSEFKINVVHLPGVTNRLADYLSQWHLDVKYSRLFALNVLMVVPLARRLSPNELLMSQFLGSST